MRNNFNLKVCFGNSPRMPYEWNKTTNISSIKLERVSSNFLKNVLTYEGIVQNRGDYLLLSDTKNAVVLKLNRDGKIVKRSFLDFNECLDVCEYACNLRESKIDFLNSNKRIKYETDLSIEKEMKEYILNLIKSSNDDDLVKYLYYLYFDEVESFSKEKLVKLVKSSTLEKNAYVYEFLTCGS